MDQMKHTAEQSNKTWVVRPWLAGISWNVGPLDEAMPPEFEGYASEPPQYVAVIVKDSKEMARRVAACWNICKGVPTEILESDLDGLMNTVSAENATLLSHLSLLRGALGEMREVCAALMRVVHETGTVDAMEIEFQVCKIQEGFGTRAEDALRSTEVEHE